MSSGATHVCRRMGIAERIAITMMVTAKNFAMMSRFPPASSPALSPALKPAALTRLTGAACVS